MKIASLKALNVFFYSLSVFGVHTAFAQPVTGVWRGKLIQGYGVKQRSAPLEVKLIAMGDSIVGTAYYYGTGNTYIRYSLKGYFGKEYNTIYWQDYYMIDVLPKKASGIREFDELMKASVDFSCPDGKTMRLEGTAQLPGVPELRLGLKKVDESLFPDEWDEVIEGYFTGMARVEVVDSVWQINSEPLLAKKEMVKIGEGDTKERATNPGAAITGNRASDPIAIKPPPTPTEPPIETAAIAKTEPKPGSKPEPQKAAPKPTPKPAAPVDITAQVAKSNTPMRPAVAPPPTAKAQTNPVVPQVAPSPENPVAKPPIQPLSAIQDAVMQGAFKERKKIIQSEIPIVGDTLELRFYDNADVDGDSISLFLNGIALFQHVRLEVRPYILKVPLESLPQISELAMVAENLGAIPPNTAYMEAIVQGKRYTARLESSEQTTAVIKLIKKE